MKLIQAPLSLSSPSFYIERKGFFSHDILFFSVRKIPKQIEMDAAARKHVDLHGNMMNKTDSAVLGRPLKA